MSDHEALYRFSRELIFLRPERFFRREAPAPQDLFDAIYAAFHVLVDNNHKPELPTDRDKQVDKLKMHIIEKVPKATLESLKPAAERFISKDFEPAIKKWIKANHKTSLRAGTLIASDVKHALAWVISEEDRMTGMNTKERVKEVLRFVFSPEYYLLRKKIGIAVK
jgi:hypothetical protein